jgi:hypothetical protein
MTLNTALAHSSRKSPHTKPSTAAVASATVMPFDISARP